MIDDHMNPSTFPWDMLHDAQQRATNVVDPDRNGGARGQGNAQLAEANRDYLYELGEVYGQEGDDWQNPNVWAGRGVLVYPSEHSPGLVPTFGVGLADNYADVVNNVRATSHLAVISV